MSYSPINKFYSVSKRLNISRSTLAGRNKNTLLSFMETWFRERYEDPIESLPYDDEGEYGYCWIYGGPFDAEEVLLEEFEEEVEEELIKELAERLSGESLNWSPRISSLNYEDFFDEDPRNLEDILKDYKTSIKNILTLSKSRVNANAKEVLLRLCYANVITSVESFLSDSFKYLIFNNVDFKRKFIETTPEFENQNFPFSKIYSKYEAIDQVVEEFLDGLIWHRFKKLIPLFKQTLDINLGDIGFLFKATLIRHDIVHRNGRNKKGDPSFIQRDQITSLVDKTDEFIKRIYDDMSNLI